MARLLDHGADVTARAGRNEMTPLDAASNRFEGVRGEGDTSDRLGAVARAFLERGAELTARAAVALGSR